ncbi:MAG: M48 family metallopeptidase [Clostridia bacterium]|nr:M48 family metallopeptidase [Clostridia bacterium]
MEIEISGIPIEIQRKPVRYLRLTVQAPNGRVRVSAPKHLSNAAIETFISSKIAWIQKQREKFEQQPEAPFAVLGKPYCLRVENGRKNSLVLSDDEAVLILRTPCTDAQREKFLREWYRTVLKEQIEIYLPKWEAITGLRCQSWQIKDMKTRWGSCNTRTRKIWLSLHLAKKPLSCLEYVILHELVHLAVPNHGKDFAAMMDRYMPGWRMIKKGMNG